MKEPNWWERFRAWLAYLIFPEPNNWYVEACERANKFEAENENLHGTIAGLAVALGCRDADLDILRKDLAALKAEIPEWRRVYGHLKAEHAALKQALTLIGDIGYDYDGYRTPHDLKKLIDEMVGYARNPQTAVDALTAEEQGHE